MQNAVMIGGRWSVTEIESACLEALCVAEQGVCSTMLPKAKVLEIKTRKPSGYWDADGWHETAAPGANVMARNVIAWHRAKDGAHYEKGKRQFNEPHVVKAKRYQVT